MSLRVSLKQGWRETKTRPERTRVGRRELLTYDAVFEEYPEHCPMCDARRPAVHGKKITKYKDLPEDLSLVAVRVERRRYKCAECGTTFFQHLPGIDRKFRMTEQLVGRILAEAVRLPANRFCLSLGIDEKTVRRVVEERLPNLRGRVRMRYGSAVVGVSLIRIAGRSRAVLVDLVNFIVIDILASAQLKVILKWFGALTPRERRGILAVSVDPRLEIRGPLRKLLGSEVILVADGAHLRRLADVGAEAVDPGRARAAAGIRADFLALLECGSADQARAALKAWRFTVGVGTKRAFRHLVKAARDWPDEIANLSDGRFDFTTRYIGHVNAQLMRLEAHHKGTVFDQARTKILGLDRKPNAKLPKFGALLPLPPEEDRCERCRAAFAYSTIRGRFTRANGFDNWVKVRAAAQCKECRRRNPYTDIRLNPPKRRIRVR